MPKDGQQIEYISSSVMQMDFEYFGSKVNQKIPIESLMENLSDTARNMSCIWWSGVQSRDHMQSTNQTDSLISHFKKQNL